MKRTLSVLLIAFMLVGMVPILSFPAFAAEAWDGTTATAPQGNGSQNDPYLIASAENLAWMAKQIGDGTVKEKTVSNPFAGKYFKQTADIDLGGKDFYPIGYYTNESDTMYVFGGIFDGQGYTIKNGKIKAYSGNEKNVNWGTGLFGVIYGATIKNLVFENMTVTLEVPVVGIVVGRSATSDITKTDFNIIEHITVKSTCVVNNNWKYDESDKFDYIGQTGGVIGMAQSATIKYCTNQANINVVGNVQANGGIAGTLNGCVVSYCVNNGNLTVDVSANANKSESQFGGIAGIILPITKGDETSVSSGNVTISNCYNTGNFTFSGSSSSAAIAIGGILGGTNSLYKGGTFTIEKCYNLNAKNTINISYSNVRVGGILGSAYQPAANASKGTDFAQINIKDSYSVEITEGKNQASHYQATNEYVYRDNKNLAGKPEVNATNVGTKTETEIKTLTAPIDQAIANAKVTPGTPGGGTTSPVTGSMMIYVAAVMLVLTAAVLLTKRNKKIFN